MLVDPQSSFLMTATRSVWLDFLTAFFSLLLSAKLSTNFLRRIAASSCLVPLEAVDLLTTEPDILIGGGVFTYSIGAILSYDCCSHVTSGCIISGKHIAKWSKRIQHEFRKVPNPFIIPVLMAEILIDKALAMRGEVLQKIKSVEEEIELVTPSVEPNGRTRTEESTPRDYRSLNFELTEGYRFLGRFDTLTERIRLILEFVEARAEAGVDPSIVPIPKRLKHRVELMQSSLKYMNVEGKNLSSRLESQIRVATSLVAQQDVALSQQTAMLSQQTAMDSKEIAAAARRDGVAMKIIAGVGAVFLPGTIIAVRSISL